MINEYRITKMGDKHFPETRTIRKVFFGLITIKSSWLRIGIHLDGYGLYKQSFYGITLEDARETISDYKEWLQKSKAPLDVVETID